MRSLLYQLGRGLAFGRIQHPELTAFLRLAPLIGAVAAAIGYAFLPLKPQLVGDGGLSRQLLAIYSTLPGFYIAALAAIATFSRQELDYTMPTPAPRLKVRVGGNEDWIDLTFRMFLSHLFAYLVTISFLAVFIFAATEVLSQSGSDALGRLVSARTFRMLARVLNALYVAIALWFTLKIVLTTLLGIYFLAERIHRPSA